MAGAAAGAQPGRAVDLDGGVDRRVSPAGPGPGEDAVGADQLQPLDPQPLAADRDRQPAARGGLDQVARRPAVDQQLDPRPVGGQGAAG